MIIANRWCPDPQIRDLIDGTPDRILTARDFDPHQVEISDLVYKKRGVLIAAGMGAGKSSATLHGARRCLAHNKVKKWLIIAPLRVAEDTWPDEFWSWAFGRNSRFSPILGTAKQRLEALRSDAPFHIINRENLTWLWAQVGSDWPYDGVIDDESSRRKSGEERSAKGKKIVLEYDGSVEDVVERVVATGGNISEFGVLAKARRDGHIKRYVGLTGTPTPNGLMDLWGQMFLVDGGARLGATKESFTRRWFFQNPYNRHDISPHDHSEKEITDRLQDVMFVYRVEDYIELPPVVTQPYWINLPSDALARYREMQREYCLSDIDVEAVNNGVLANKLLQIANGSIYDTDKVSHYLHKRKLEELEKIYDDAGDMPIMVAYGFKFDKEAILNRFGNSAYVFGEHKDDLKRWKNREYPMMLLHPASAGHGMNFQRGSNILVWYGLTWSLELYQQLNKRLPRRGQLEDRVYHKLIVARNTYDVRQLKALEVKGTTQHRITEAFNVMRNIVERTNCG